MVLQFMVLSNFLIFGAYLIAFCLPVTGPKFTGEQSHTLRSMSLETNNIFCKALGNPSVGLKKKEQCRVLKNTPL